MFCQKCGAKNHDNAKFCASCGNPFQIRPKENTGTPVSKDPDATAYAADEPVSSSDRLAERSIFADLEEPGYGAFHDDQRKNNWDPEKTLLHSEEEMWYDAEADEDEFAVQSSSKNRSGSGNGLKILIPVIGIFLLIIAIALFVLVKGSSDKDPDAKEDTETEETVKEDETGDEETEEKEESETKDTESEDKETDDTDAETEAKEEAAKEEQVYIEPARNDPASMELVAREGVNTAKLNKVTVAGANSSSDIVQEGYDNTPMRAFDGDYNTSWQEGSQGDGSGEFIQAVFDREYEVKYITFKIGNWRDNEKDYKGNFYTENNRPKAMSIWLDDVQYEITFPDGRTEFCVELSYPMPASESYLRIESVYKGTLYDDCCIAEVEYYTE